MRFQRVLDFATFNLAAVIAIVFLLAVPAAASDADKLQIASRSGTYVFSVELAKTDDQRARGLMFRKELPEGQGMLFDFERNTEISMWMQNTYIPLDMIFIRADGRIHRIAENTKPLSTKIVSSGGPVRAVLEVIGGTAKKLGLNAGDRVSHPTFRQ